MALKDQYAEFSGEAADSNQLYITSFSDMQKNQRLHHYRGLSETTVFYLLCASVKLWRHNMWALLKKILMQI